MKALIKKVQDSKQYELILPWLVGMLCIIGGWAAILSLIGVTALWFYRHYWNNA